MRTARTPEQAEVLHVARADLNHVRVLLDEIHSRFIQSFSHDLQSVSFANFRENLQTFLA